mmetsp:Transcript_54782/g.168826  ORF Transcript_54782/g.168826 Transcript_54782/m.168826 type:complete len:227 (-) Transcript_54782:602-1282(-)
MSFCRRSCALCFTSISRICVAYAMTVSAKLAMRELSIATSESVFAAEVTDSRMRSSRWCSFSASTRSSATSRFAISSSRVACAFSRSSIVALSVAISWSRVATRFVSAAISNLSWRVSSFPAKSMAALACSTARWVSKRTVSRCDASICVVFWIWRILVRRSSSSSAAIFSACFTICCLALEKTGFPAARARCSRRRLRSARSLSRSPSPTLPSSSPMACASSPAA